MFVVYATPFFRSDTPLFAKGMLDLEGVRLGVISQDPVEMVPDWVRSRLTDYVRINDPLSVDEIGSAARQMQQKHGRIERLLAINEQIQLPVAQVRSRLDIPGMQPETVVNFRDKSRMKERFRGHGVPCAKSRSVTDDKQAWKFIDEIGFPVCVKPVDGAAAQSTYRVESAEAFKDVLRASAPSWEHPLQIEEFVTGQEHSFETISIDGKRHWHSLTRYHPTPLDVMRNPWIQWKIVLPREVDDPQYDDIRAVAEKALTSLGVESLLTHMEWFRRHDGTLAVSEVGGRPPGAQIITLTNRAHDLDLYAEWARLMIKNEFRAPQERKYAAGVAFLRGLGSGRVKAVHGLDWVLKQLGDMVTDYDRPSPGQPSAITYEGEGFVLVRHPETAKVEEALEAIVSTVRVELVN